VQFALQVFLQRASKVYLVVCILFGSLACGV
jgi:hypothetical protein